MYCPNCGSVIDQSMNYCPRCGHRIPPYSSSNLTPTQYYHTIFNFVYDKYKPWFKGDEFLGICVQKDGKFGFLRKKGNPFGLVYIPCDYDFLIPVLGKSIFRGGTAIHPIVFEVEKDGKWGVSFTHINDRIVGPYAGIPCKYDFIRVIRKYPSVAIARKNKRYCFVKVIDSQEFSDIYEEIYEVYDSSKANTGGLYFACVRSWTPTYPGSLSLEGQAVIFDLVSKSIVGYDTMRVNSSLTLYSNRSDNKNGHTWKRVSR